MKKRFLILSATLLLCCLVFISVSCASEEVIQTETDFAINEIYLAAQQLGFEGTVEEFLSFVKGSDGRGIKHVYINEEGILTIVLTDDTVYTLGNVIGSDGKDGNDGLSVTKADIDEKGFLILTFSDGTFINCGDVCGEDGKDGLNGTDGEQGPQGEKGDDGLDGRGIEKLFITADGMLIAVFTDSDEEVIVGKVSGESGEQGKPGNGIASVSVTENGHLIITLEDGSEFDCGNIRGEDGKDGEQGIQGEKGEQGEQGIQGEKGEQGEQGIQGEKGEKGEQGIQGEKGEQGEQGIQGEKGEKGEQGIQGEKGEQGEQGIQGEKGENGLSAYEIYLKYHPEYTGNEGQWIEDLVNGRLSSDGSGDAADEPGELTQHTVYIYCGERKYTQLVEEGKTIDFGTVDKTLNGYEFLYWESDGKNFAEDTPIRSDITVNAVYKAPKPDYTEITDLSETITIGANERYRIIVSDVFAFNVQALMFYSESGTTEFEMLVGEVIVDSVTFECAGEYCEYYLTDYKHSGGYILDIWFKGENGGTLSITPIF